MRYQFVEEHRDEFRVTLMCRTLHISSSGYYAWRKRPSSQRKMANQKLVEQIKTAHKESYATYGSPRIYKELQENGVKCSENRIARLMKAHNIQAKQSKKRKMTTKANKNHPKAANLLDRAFTAVCPNEKWTTDITYIPTAEGWLYLAVILDLFSRRIVGWSMSERINSKLVMNALNMAVQQRNPEPDLLHHSDRGSQYTGGQYRNLLSDSIMLSSMSRTGNCWDNAPSESFFGTLKTELTHHRAYETRNEAKTDIFFYLEGFYNSRRRHSTLGYVSPDAYEAAFYKYQTALTACP
jgi:putative transposase